MKTATQQHIETVERKLLTMRKLRDEIAELTAYKTMLQDEVIIEHFGHNVEYRTPQNLLLATYQQVKSKRFQQSEFKKEHPAIYESFEKEIIVPTFRLK